jgi:hypothetical protein
MEKPDAKHFLSPAQESQRDTLDSKSSASDLLFEDSDDTDDTDNTEPETYTATPPSRLSWKPTILRRTCKWDTQDSLQRMEDELAGIVRPKPILYQKKPYTQPSRVQAKEHMIDIAAISALGMHYNLRAESNEVFVTSLYEIDRIL